MLMKGMLLMQRFRRDQSAIGTLEVMLIIAVVIILFIIFRKFIVEVITDLVGRAETDIEQYSRND